MNRLLASLLLLTLCAPVSASSYDKMIVFGDSLSDTGNAFAASQYPPAPYYNGRFSNGPVWVEALAPLLDVPTPTAAMLPGLNATNCAIGGACATGGLIPSLEAQVAAYCTTATPAANDLFILWAGANDLLDGQTNPAIPASAVTHQVATLAAAGAKNFLVLNLPPLGHTPRFVNSPLQMPMDSLAIQFNSALATGLDELLPELPADVHLTQFDVHDLFTQLAQDPAQAGFTNITDSAFLAGPPASIVANPDEYVYWDSIHPTHAAHQMLAEHVAAVLVPEPVGAITLAMVGLSLLARRPRRVLSVHC
ncbi:MAG TPA: SGNH/GDSL hydrolase family protein [Tepidisphaeraceae bacterium]|nr:SGNH/GDSL hydrolase family protein [Tepidisphaeraceae bacterium]